MNRVDNSLINYDVIIPLGPDDIDFIQRVISYIYRCLININNIYILTAYKNVSYVEKKLKTYKKCHVIDEDTLIPNLTLLRVKQLLEKYASERVNRAGWYFQQFLKMGFSRSSLCGQYYLSWDSDTLPLAPINFFDRENILYNPKMEYNPNYFVTAKKFGIDKVVDCSFISESMMFSSTYMREMLKTMECSDVEGGDWIEKVIAAGDYSNPLPTFSEFETYGNYCAINYPTAYKPRHLNTFREAGYIAGRNISENCLREMSFDLDMASFELFHQPLFPYNLPYIWKNTKKKFNKILKMRIRDIFSYFTSKKAKKEMDRQRNELLNEVKIRLPHEERQFCNE